jgi:hypothetical protein
MIAFAKLESLLGPQAFGDSVVSKRHGSPAEEDLRISGSSSALCSAHKGSAAAGRMFEDPEILRSASAGTLGVWNNNHAGQFKQIYSA